MVTPIAPPTPSGASSTLVTSTAGSYFYSTSSGSITGSLTSTGTVSSTATGITVLPKPSSTNMGAIVAGVVVPLVLILIAVAVWMLRKWRPRAAQNTRSWHPNVKFTPQSKPYTNHVNHVPPHPIRPPPRELQDRNQGPYRVASPTRPERPASIPESVLDAMSNGSGLRSDVAEHGSSPIEPAHLSNLGPLNDDEVDTVNPNTDGNPLYDGTRKKYIKTAIERGLPLENLSRPSVRVANAARRTGVERRSYLPARSSSFSPEPLRVHKKSASDDRNNMATRYATNLEEGRRPSPALTEQDFMTNVRRNLSKTPPLEGAITEHEELVADDSSVDGSFAKEYEVEQKREESLAALEGRTPEITSSEFSPRGARSEETDIYGAQIPPRRRDPIPEETIAARRGGIQEWI